MLFEMIQCRLDELSQSKGNQPYIIMPIKIDVIAELIYEVDLEGVKECIAFFVSTVYTLDDYFRYFDRK